MHGFHSDDASKKFTKVRADDFKRALEAMGSMTFKIDLSFAYMFHRQFCNQSSTIEVHSLIDEASDTILSEIINRNFVECPVDSTMFIYRDNPEDNQQQTPS